MQNGFIERINRGYREAILDMLVFQSLREVCEWARKWLKEYSEDRHARCGRHGVHGNYCV